MLLEIGLFIKRKKNTENKKQKTKTKTKQKPEKKKYQNCIKSGLSQFLFLQQKI